MNLKPVIVPAKVLANGKHRIRIAISHHGATRYFLTRFVVDNPNCISNGVVVGIPNASYTNQVLMQTMSNIYKAYDSIDDADYLSCSQLKEQIEEKMKGDKPVTMFEMIDTYNEYRKHTVAKNTLAIQHSTFKVVKEYFTSDFLLKRLTSDDLYGLMEYMEKQGLSTTTQAMEFQVLQQLIIYAVRHNKVSYEISPFKDFQKPKPVVRDVAITIGELRRIRDLKIEGKHVERLILVRDIFMLSFFLCGMNIADILNTDFSRDYVKFRRQKTEKRKQKNDYTEFTIQPEARKILDRYCVNGKFMFKNKPHTKNSYLNLFYRKMPLIADMCGIKTRLIFYSARKTFAQLANELMIKDSIIEYCIGDAVTNKQRVIGSYVTINKRIADKAIRKVFDAVASDKSMDELMEEFI